jgi:iron complex outermembrane recepter protein
MNKKIILSSIAALAISSSAQDLGTIEVKKEINTEVVNKISTKEVKNADLAEALSKKSPNISLIRRSGIANDIILRGQKRDNIRVVVDDAIIHGACPNRMDPPTSHIITSNVESVEIQEGPFDVTEFGSLSGGIKINTKQPTAGTSGDVGMTLGSYGYRKTLFNINAGNETVQALLSFSKENGDQYEDGDGNTLAEQTEKGPLVNQYAPDFKDMEAYEKQSLMTKINVNINENHQFEIGATKNESDNILYPSTPMDADYDDSNLYTIKYTAKNLGDFSKKLEIKTYKTDVDHPMSTKYRNNGAMMYMTNHLTTDTYGAKIINSFDALDREFKIGLDTSKRNWDGSYSMSNGMNLGNSINDTDTKNNAIFLECKNQITDELKLELGLRYDRTKITNGGILQDNDYNGLSGNIMTTYQVMPNTKLFIGLGQSSRVPDARELYMLGRNTTPTEPTPTQMIVGTPDLKETKNREVDFGIEHQFNSGKIKGNFFYSDLKDYIYYKNAMAPNKFENIDATIYGLELSGAYYINDQFTFDAGYTWKKGEKDDAITGQTDKDLADISPAKLTLGLTYDYNDNTFASIEFVHVDTWDTYDEDNGEQELDSYNVVNLKAQTLFNKNLELTVGIDNVFDETYAVSNTYKDLTLLTDGTTSEVMLLNEPGRYIYTSIKYKF